MLANAYGYDVYNLDGGLGQWLAAGLTVEGNNLNPTNDEDILKKGFKAPLNLNKETYSIKSVIKRLNDIALRYNIPRDLQIDEFNNLLAKLGIDKRLEEENFKIIMQQANTTPLITNMVRMMLNSLVVPFLTRNIPEEAFDEAAKERLSSAVEGLSSGMGFLTAHIISGRMPLAISPFGLAELVEENNGNVQLVDARSQIEYEGYHVPGAINVFSDSSEFIDLLSSNRLDKSAPTVFLCNSGARASEAAFIAKDYGFENVYDLAGGTVNWTAAGMPTILKSAQAIDASDQSDSSEIYQVEVEPGALAPPMGEIVSQPSEEGGVEAPGGLEPLVPEAGFGAGC
ncbi:MAG: rhodanese-like domain-containing protein [Deferribacterota bacterium]|nr:rhodanese-like domain-containing protein [Deferribacterota bacterium]